MKIVRTKMPVMGVVTAGLAMLAITIVGPADAQSLRPHATSAPVAAGGIQSIPLPAPKNFVRHVTNRYFPLKPGTKWIYEGYGADEGERIITKVLKRTKKISGIKATVVLDVATLDGEVIERTHDWYAQDKWGRVWYLGEATTKFEDGTTSTAGSWKHGVDGASAGIQMFKRGRLNQPYYQEFLAGEAEDQGELLSRRMRAVVPTGDYRHVWMTKDTTQLEPEVVELKLYAPGVGLVLEVGTSPDQSGAELVGFKRG